MFLARSLLNLKSQTQTLNNRKTIRYFDATQIPTFNLTSKGRKSIVHYRVATRGFLGFSIFLFIAWEMNIILRETLLKVNIRYEIEPCLHIKGFSALNKIELSYELRL